MNTPVVGDRAPQLSLAQVDQRERLSDAERRAEEGIAARVDRMLAECAQMQLLCESDGWLTHRLTRSIPTGESVSRHGQ